MDRLFYGTIFATKTMCTGSKFTCEDVPDGETFAGFCNTGYMSTYSYQNGNYVNDGYYRYKRYCVNDPSDTFYRDTFFGPEITCEDLPPADHFTVSQTWTGTGTRFDGNTAITQRCSKKHTRQHCSYKTQEQDCDVLTNHHMANSLQACGDLCASRTSCTAITYMDEPSSSCAFGGLDSAPIVGMCILHSYPKVGQGVTKISLRGGSQEMAKSSGWSTTTEAEPYKRTCLEGPKKPSSGVGMPSDGYLCNVGPGSDRTWPQKCGIVSYHKRSVILDATPDPGSGSGEAGSGSGEAGSGSGEAGSGSSEAGSAGEQVANVAATYTAPQTFVGHGTC